MVEMKSLQPVRSFTDFLQEKVIEKSLESLRYNLNLQVELVEKCPFPQWKKWRNKWLKLREILRIGNNCCGVCKRKMGN